MNEPFLTEEPLAIRDLAFAIVDLETTGGSPKAKWHAETGRYRRPSEITEVGVVLMQGAVVQDRWTSLCAVEGPIPGLIQDLTGIRPDMLMDAPAWEKVAMELAPRLEGRIWLAHHAAFDGSFLKAQLPQGLWSRHRLACTRNLARRLVPEVPRRSLSVLCEHFGIVNARAHRALQDAEATAEVLQHLIQRAEDRGLDAEGFLALGELNWTKL